MFKELFKRWFGSTTSNASKQKRIKGHKFETIEEAREFIQNLPKNKSKEQIVKYLNRNGYRTVRGCEFTESRLRYYLADDFTLSFDRYRKAERERNRRARKKGVPA